MEHEVRKAVEALLTRIEGRTAMDETLAPLTSFRVGGTAAVLVEPVSEADLEVTAEIIKLTGMEVLMLGKGSNLLVSDAGFPGVVVRMAKGFEQIREVNSSSVEAGAGTSLPQLANWAARRGLTGMEFAVAIPATVGGAVAMNAGAHGADLSGVLESVRVCSLVEGRFSEVPARSLEMGYRSAFLGEGNLVCAAKFALTPGDREEILDRMRQYRTHRADTQPAKAPNAGSTFKNPDGSTAGGLIDAAGLKGFEVGAAQVSHRHGNFVLAGTGATAQDVFDLMAHVQSVVLKSTGVTLLPEVRIVGEFERSSSLIVS
ncbi:MAG: UDP-N-acetylmuramate dehydrogenase [Actinobacteria bacterium]|nr:UDP-N-acetylmuramate dehydrogenase [Actinomycetota bacterium]